MIKYALAAPLALLAAPPSTAATEVFRGTFAQSNQAVHLGGAEVGVDLRISGKFSEPFKFERLTFARSNGSLYDGGYDDQPIINIDVFTGESFTYRFIGYTYKNDRGIYVETLREFRITSLSDLAVDYTIVVSRFAVVPEPATWAMIIGGFGLLGAAARRLSVKTRTYA